MIPRLSIILFGLLLPGCLLAAMSDAPTFYRVSVSYAE